MVHRLKRGFLILSIAFLSSIGIAQAVYNVFSPGGDLAGTGSTWNSQILTNGITHSINVASGNGYQINGTTVVQFPDNDTASIALGNGALTAQTTASAANNVGIGINAGAGITSGIKEIAIGGSACGGGASDGALTGINNVCVGQSAGAFLSGAATGNTFIGGGGVGIGSVGTNNTASDNTFVGFQSGVFNSTGASNTALGWATMGATSSGGTVLTGNFNTALGATALQNIQGAAANNTAVGEGACILLTTGAANMCLGTTALKAVTTGADNVGIGFQAGLTLTGSNNTIIGTNVASVTCANTSSDIMIGTSASTDCLASTSSNEIDIAGLIFYNSNSLAAPVVSACGSTPSIDTHANNKSGTVTVGSGTVASCTVTLAGTGYSTWSHCRVTPHSTIAAFAYSYTKTVITVTATSLTSDLFDYDCDGY